MENLVSNQTDLGKEIQRIIANYNKDPKERKKNRRYYEVRLQKLESNWNEFEDGHLELEALGIPPDHEYIKKNYFPEIKQLWEKYRNILMNEMSAFDEPKQCVSEAKPAAHGEVQRNIRRQGAFIQSLKRLLSSAWSNIDNQCLDFYELTRTEIRELWAQIVTLNLCIWENSSDPVALGYNFNDYLDLEEKTREMIITLSSKIPSIQIPNSMQHLGAAQSSLVRLPKISIPKFDGNYAHWRQFADLFDQLVHQQDIADCQKMWYLKTNLTGEAEKLVRHFTLSNENYRTAWKTLHDRYENQRLLVATLINKLVSQPSHGSDASPTAIKQLHDTTQECLRGLENLGVSVKTWDPIILHILLKRLDSTTHLLYEQSLDDPKKLQSVDSFLTFCETRFQSLEALGLKESTNHKRQTTKGLSRAAQSMISVATCILCKEDHSLYSCKAFARHSPSKRLQIVRTNNMCTNCLKPGHRASTCEAGNCRKCSQKHNTLLHLDDGPNNNNARTTTPAQVQLSNQAITLAAQKTQQSREHILLSTAKVRLIAASGTEVECRALLDSGSQVNLVTNRIIKKLGIKPNTSPMLIQGVGGATECARQRVSLKLKSKTSGFSEHLEAFVLKQIVPPQPSVAIDITSWPIPKNVKLADPDFNRTLNIDVLIGAEFYSQLLAIGQIRLGSRLPTLQNTVFGWIVSGRVGTNISQNAVCSVNVTDEQLSTIIEKFWKVEEIKGEEHILSTSEKACERHYNETTQRLSNGRFLTALPFAREPEVLGDSKDMAWRRFYALERRLARDDGIRQQYIHFMEEYFKMGHMEEVDIKTITPPYYFLPHHCVLKPDSRTTKLRVVFDASAKTTTGVSLNDILHAGPTVQSELFSILLRFRLPRYVFTADIQQMYRQVLISPDDRKFQMIFWRSDPNQSLKCYRLCTVTYGTSAAPYLATRCLQRLAEEEKGSHPQGAAVLARDFYVDDVITGFNTLADATIARDQLTAILLGAGFKLRKWCANHPALLRGIPVEDQEILLNFYEADNETIKTLGVTWLPKTDQFKIKTNHVDQHRITKRVIASEIARLFDPLGLVAPVVTRAKILLQQLWQLQLDWDAAVPQEIHTQWETFRTRLNTLDTIQIPRHVRLAEATTGMQLHVFADASESAYGAAAYFRSVSRTQVLVRLLCAKSRIAPIKRLTIPRLELCAARLAAELAERIKGDLNIEGLTVTFWTDSEIVLSWINSKAANYQTFVANRIAAIQGLTIPQQWRHVGSKDNPADVLSRGLSPDRLSQCHLWFYGPRFLHGAETLWPLPYCSATEGCLERKRSALPLTTTHDTRGLFDKVNHRNSFQTLQRIVAFTLRFISQITYQLPRKPVERSLTAEELENALQIIVKEMQKEEFKEEIQQLKKHKCVDQKNRISELTPFLDDKGILRVGGRLKDSTLAYDAKYQMLLPEPHPWTKLLMIQYHEKNSHVGPQALLANIRQRFWPIKGKSLARSVVHHCVRCAKMKPKMLQQIMGNLPPTRVQPARPFVNSGVDFCGPLWIHYKIKGKRPTKCYLAVFCCFATKAVHLELVSDLTTDAFIGALKRFMARRGRCKELFSDNATNFVGARNKLSDLIPVIHSVEAQEAIKSTCSSKGVNFNFIPPKAPHFGGLWEAAVKSAKNLLVKTVSSASLTYEELETVVVEIEAILNSRPITPMSSNPNDLTALTPGHFLVGEALSAPVDAHAKERKISLLSRWELVSHLKHEFWRRWTLEYLNELQYRRKWKTTCQNVKPGLLVIVKQDNIPVLHWPLGRIVKTHAGQDGCVRVVDVKTTSGIIRRPIHNLAPLPSNDDLASETQVSDSKPSCSNQSDPCASNQQDPQPGPSSDPHHQHFSSSNEILPKRRRVATNISAGLALLLTLIVLPLARPSFVQLQHFNGQPGFHFEHLGTVNLATANWKLIVYYNLAPYWEDTIQAMKYIDSMKDLCDQLTDHELCRPIINQQQQIIEKLKAGNELLQPQSHGARSKRGAFNIVGNIANSLFGILDANYAKEITASLDSIQGNEEYLLFLLKNQTSVVDSTINIIKENQVLTEQSLTIFDNKIRKLITYVNHTNDELYQIRLLQSFTARSMQLILTMVELKRVQSSIIDVLTDTRNGKIPPSLLSLQQLRREATIIKNNLPAGLKLPIDEDDLQHLYQLMEMQGCTSDKYIIFQLTVPVVTAEIFELLHVLTIPVLINETLVAIQSSTPFLAINLHRDQFFTLNEHEVSACRIITTSVYICKSLHPIYHKTANISSCELNYLNDRPMMSRCELKSVGSDQYWVSLIRPNNWLFGLKQNITATLVCGTKALSTVLSGSGILQIHPSCVFKHDSLTINGRQSYTIRANLSYTKLGVPAHTTTREATRWGSDKFSVFKEHSKKLKAIEDQLASRDHFTLPNKIGHHDIHQYTISYIGLILAIIIIIILTWRAKNILTGICKSKPTPRPRRSTSQGFDVTVI